MPQCQMFLLKKKMSVKVSAPSQVWQTKSRREKKINELKESYSMRLNKRPPGDGLLGRLENRFIRSHVRLGDTFY